jgi:hypothetical protein
MLLPNRITMSGLTTQEAARILAAFLALSESERKAILALPHEVLVSRLRRIIQVNDMRRDVALKKP